MYFLRRRAPRAVSRRSFQSKKFEEVSTGMLVHLSDTVDVGSAGEVDMLEG